jgi:hypothetical protein
MKKKIIIISVVLIGFIVAFTSNSWAQRERGGDRRGDRGDQFQSRNGFGDRSNQNPATVIAIVRRTALNRNPTGAITIARPTGTGLNFGPGVIGRSTDMVAPDGSTGDRTIRW